MSREESERISRIIFRVTIIIQFMFVNYWLSSICAEVKRHHQEIKVESQK